MTRSWRPGAASRLVSIRDAGTRLGLGRTRLSSLLDHGDLLFDQDWQQKAHPRVVAGGIHRRPESARVPGLPGASPAPGSQQGRHVNAVFAAASAALDAGLSIIPVGPNKKPTEGWKRFQEEVASRSQVEAWFLGQCHSGLGIICGAVSGNAEMLEWESRAILDEYRAAADAVGFLPLLDRIVAGLPIPRRRHSRHLSLRGDRWQYRARPATEATP